MDKAGSDSFFETVKSLISEVCQKRGLSRSQSYKLIAENIKVNPRQVRRWDQDDAEPWEADKVIESIQTFVASLKSQNGLNNNFENLIKSLVERLELSESLIKELSNRISQLEQSTHSPTSSQDKIYAEEVILRRVHIKEL